MSGIACARVLRATGHDVTVIESEADVGGVWSTRRHYPGLGLQSDKRAYSFSDCAMPDEYPRYPSAAQVHAYLEDYVRSHELEGCLRLGTKLVSAVPVPDGQGWELDLCGPTGTRRESVDWLVLANGLFSTPHVPDVPGRREFEQAGGRVVATVDVGDGGVYRGRHLVVLGWGKSASDIASAAVGVASTVSMVVRRVTWKVPDRIGLVPWQRLVLTRAGEFLLWAPRRRRLVSRVFLMPVRWIRPPVLSWLERVIRRQQQLDRRGLVPTAKLGHFHLETVGFLEAVDRGAISVHRDETVVRLHGSAGQPLLELSNGTMLACEVLVAATGYDQDLSMFTRETLDTILEPDGDLHLYRHTLPGAAARLAFVGWHGSFHSPLSAEVQSMWVAAYISDRVAEPSPRTRRRFESIYRLSHDRAEASGGAQLRRAGGSIPDLDAWIEEAGLSMPGVVSVQEMLRPIDPMQYDGLLAQLTRVLDAGPTQRSPRASRS